MPEPVRSDQKYLPGLDGLRALAVAAVVAYHLDLGWAQGGLLGVGVFFTLSGYLITDILLGHWDRKGRLGLGDFWLRRARRLLPALFAMLVVVAIWVNTLDRSELPGFRGDVVASALYVSNWWYIAEHASYYAQFAPPAPLDHLWSLAVEEQFYLVWPWLVLFGVLVFGRLAVGRSKRGGGYRGGYLSARTRYSMAGATLVLAAASAVEMAVLYHPGADPTRVYEGTDTRAFGLLFGAALAMVWPTRRARAPKAPTWLLDLAGVAGLAVIGILIWRTNEYSAFMFRGGLVLLSLATVLVVAAVAVPGGLLGRALGCSPLRWTGVRSYGIYLWHYPLIVLTAPALVAGGFSTSRAVAAAAASVVVAALSWRFVEEPIRRGLRAGFNRPALPRVLKRREVLTPVAVSGLCVLALGGIGASVMAVMGHPVSSSEAGSANSVAASRAQAAGSVTGANRGRRKSSPTAVKGARNRAAPAPRTACRSVVHMGDSTSEGLISSDYLPDPANRIPARYAGVGVTRTIMEISGGTSIVETINGEQNEYTIAKQLVAGGYHGCWVLALGTNDTADVYAGSNVGRVQRIKRMMSVIGDQPVMWVEVKSLLSSGPYSEQDMTLWNQALEQVQPSYHNMHLYDWPAVVQNGWFINDGIHYTSYGYQQRARLIADALAAAFPAGSGAGPSAGAGDSSGVTVSQPVRLASGIPPQVLDSLNPR
jgi:peptidoglycan/LPS O-acetylase OafA/YrhL